MSYAVGSGNLLSFIVDVQPRPSRLCLLTHITFVYLSGTDPWRSHTQASLSAMVGANYFNSRSGGTDAAANVHTLDFLAFSLIISVAARSKTRGLRLPTILRAIAEDATRYFLVIFTSHFVLEMTLNLGRVSATVSLRSQ